MIKRVSVAAMLLLPLGVLANDPGKGEDIFDARCAHCHSLSRTQKMINDVKPQDRPAYLKKFLRSHPSKLSDDDEDLVIQMLSAVAE